MRTDPVAPSILAAYRAARRLGYTRRQSLAIAVWGA